VGRKGLYLTEQRDVYTIEMAGRIEQLEGRGSREIVFVVVQVVKKEHVG